MNEASLDTASAGVGFEPYIEDGGDEHTEFERNRERDYQKSIADLLGVRIPANLSMMQLFAIVNNYDRADATNPETTGSFVELENPVENGLVRQKHDDQGNLISEELNGDAIKLSGEMMTLIRELHLSYNKIEDKNSPVAQEKAAEIATKAREYYQKFGGLSHKSQQQLETKQEIKFGDYTTFVNKLVRIAVEDDEAYEAIQYHLNDSPENTPPSHDNPEWQKLLEKYGDIIQQIKEFQLREEDPLGDADNIINAKEKKLNFLQRYLRRLGRLALYARDLAHAQKVIDPETGHLVKGDFKYKKNAETYFWLDTGAQFNKATLVLGFSAIIALFGEKALPKELREAEQRYGQKTLWENWSSKVEERAGAREFSSTGMHHSGGAGKNLADPFNTELDASDLNIHNKDWRGGKDRYHRVNETPPDGAFYIPTKPDKFETVSPEMRARRAIDDLIKNSRRDSNLASLYGAVLGSDHENLNWEENREARNTFDDALTELAGEYRKAANLHHLEAQIQKRINALKFALEHKAGKIWEKYLERNGRAPVATERNIIKEVKDDEETLAETKKQADAAREKWRAKVKENHNLLNGNIIERKYKDASGRERVRKILYTFDIIPGDKLPLGLLSEIVFEHGNVEHENMAENRRDAIRRAFEYGGGEFTDIAVASDATATEQELRHTDFIQITYNAYDDDGSNPVQKVVGWADLRDSRAGGFVPNPDAAIVRYSGDLTRTADEVVSFVETVPE